MNIVSFYSYKGGVGRSQLCANIAAYLCYQKGKRVLLWDWDFEAPGLHYFFGLKNENITKKGTLELLEQYMVTMRKNEEVKSAHLKFISQDENIINLPVSFNTNTNRKGCIDLIAAGMYNNEFNVRANNFDWFEFYSMMDGVNYIELLKEKLKDLNYDYVLIDSRTGICDYSGICNVQLPDINVVVVAPTMQNFEGSKGVIDKIIQSEYLKIKKRKPRILPILSRLDYSNPKFNDWVDRFTEYFSGITQNLDDKFDKEFLPEMFADVYFKDTFLPYTPAISAGENVLFSVDRRQSRFDYTRPYQNIAEVLENISKGDYSFYKKVDEDTWREYSEKAISKGETKKTAIAYTQIGIKQNNIDNQVDYFEKAIQLKPDYFLPYCLAGSALLTIGKIDKAIEKLKKATELDPQDFLSHHSLGLAYNLKGDFNNAIASYKTAITLNPTNSDTFFNLSNAYFKYGELDNAINSYQKGIRRDASILPGSPIKAWSQKPVDIKDQTGKELETILKGTTEDKPNTADAFINIGNAYNKKGETDKAIESYLQAIQLAPNANALALLGNAYKKKGQLKNAIESFEKALDMNPDNTPVYIQLGQAYLENGQTEKAFESFLKGGISNVAADASANSGYQDLKTNINIANS